MQITRIWYRKCAFTLVFMPSELSLNSFGNVVISDCSFSNGQIITYKLLSFCFSFLTVRLHFYLSVTSCCWY